MKGGASVVMDNWLNQEFGQFKKEIVGLYIQGIQGPLGIPFGEFVQLKHLYVRGKDYDSAGKNWFSPTAEDWKKVSIVPCTFFSNAGPTVNIVVIFNFNNLNLKF